MVETLRSVGTDSQESPASEVILFTDGNGAGEAMRFSDYFDAQVLVMGEAVDNVSNNFLSYVDAPEETGQEGAIVCASSITNYSDKEVSIEVSLYEGDTLREIRQLSLGAGETTLCFYEAFVWNREALRSEIGSVEFVQGGKGDSLSNDNTAYAVAGQAGQIQAALVGDGNTYIEKAYQAVVGGSLTKLQSGQGAQEDTGETVYIYDVDTAAGRREDVRAMVFGDEAGAQGTEERVLLTVTNCDLTAGLPDFSIGVNETKVYEVPSWGTGFLWAGEQCAGYYGEHDGVKTVVVGFDIRESDFPLKAEFPVFISNALHFLSDTSLLANNIYMAGDRVVFHPQPDFDVAALTAETGKAGLYEVSAGDVTEQYVVRFATESQSDGRIVAQGTVEEDVYSGQLVKKRLRNIVLALALILLAVEWFVYVRQMRYRGRFYLAVRLAGAAMLILALLGVSVSRRSGVNTTIFLADISNSNEQNLEAVEDYLDEAIRRMPGGNQYGIVTFGKNSLVDQFLTGEDHFSRIMSLPDKTATNFEEAISRALAMIPPG
ncbi:MAG: VWA domain-containing protein, partial [Acetatifactor sp.]|nr:VWA domain-containing protein [Acetatifactor sp.]